MSHQVTSTILMVRPVNFRYNPETASDNYYQKVIEGLSADQVQEKALEEFDSFVSVLKNHNVNVIVVNDTPEPTKSDSIFPNNWITFHTDGTVVLYPMYAPSRRLERRNDIIDHVLPGKGFRIDEVFDMSDYEKSNQFLEGTGSLILDRENKIAYASLSERTSKDLVDIFCNKFSYRPVVFSSFQTVEGIRKPIYHTNVLMCVATDFAILSDQSIDDENERRMVIDALEKTGKEVIKISEEQVERFAGNMLQVKSIEGKPYLVMSTAAYNSLSSDQKSRIQKYSEILHSNLETIEACGGGSARCMMAEVFLPSL